jgi:hypothetical protein
LKLEDYLRTRFAKLMYPAAQAFVLNPMMRRVIFCVPFVMISAIFFLLKNYLGEGSNAFQQANFFNNNHFKTVLLADKIDYGYLSFYGLYVAFAWKILGNSLIINYLLLIPFFLGNVWQGMTLGEKILGPFKAPLFALAVSIPILIPSYSNTGEQISRLFFSLLAINQIYPTQNALHKNNTLTIVSLVGLSFSGLEGIVTIFILLLFDILSLFFIHKKKSTPLSISALFNLLKPYLWSSIPMICFFIFHFYNKGWIINNPNLEILDLKQMVEDGFIFPPFSILSYLVLMLLAFCILFKIRFNNILHNSNLMLILFIIFLLIPYAFNTHLFTLNYLIISLLCLKLISDLKTNKVQTALYLLFFIALVIGQI